MRALWALGIGGTAVHDLSPLAGLGGLRFLAIDETPVADLRPIRGLTRLGTGEGGGLDFARTPFADSGEAPRRLAAIADPRERARATLAWLGEVPR